VNPNHHPGVSRSIIHSFLRPIACLLILAASAGCAGPPGTQDPLPDAIGDWVAGERSEYVGDDLFIYINGGAEIYHEHGFDRIVVREYARGDERVAVELYTMSGSAYGVYSYARSQSGQPAEIGAGGTIAEYYLHFWSGRFLVVVTSHTTAPDVQAAILEIGHGIGKSLPATGDVPQLMALLPVEDCVPGSEIFIAGAIGLNNAAPIAAELFEGFTEGATIECGSTRLVALAWDDPARAAAALDQAKIRALQIDRLTIDAADDDRLSIHFDEDGFAAAARTGGVIRIAADRGTAPDLDTVFPTTGWEVSDE